LIESEGIPSDRILVIQDAGWAGGQHAMARPLSNDLRECAVAAVLAGESCRTAASRFGVAVSSVVKWSQRHRATGSVRPGKMGGHRKPLLDPHRAFIVERIKQTPHLTLHGLKNELAVRGVRVSHNAVWMFLRREGLRFKKTLFAIEQARSDVARRRRRWRSWQAGLDPRRLVFIDETPAFAGGRLWIKTNMAPLRGWGPRGERVRGFAPHGHWRTLTFLGALRCDSLAAPCVFDGPINGECFRAYVEQQLVPVPQARRHRHHGQPPAVTSRPRSAA
jgi:transposase